MATNLFLSYRRDDAAGDARSILQRLESRFGAGSVFIDVDAIKKGDDFATTLTDRLKECVAMVVVIGPKWLDARDENGNRRLDYARDYVRQEVLAGLQRGIPLIPVLIGNVAMPQAADLPDDIKPLSTRMAARITHENFNSDMEALEAELNRIFGSGRYVDQLRGLVRLQRRILAISAAALAVLAVLSRAELADFADRVMTTANVYVASDRIPLPQYLADGLSQEVGLARANLRRTTVQFMAEKKGAWALSQMVAVAPDLHAEDRAKYIDSMSADLSPDCNCYMIASYQHAVASAWTVLSFASMKLEVPGPVLDGLIRSQRSQGWWSSSLDAVDDDRHAALYSTAMIVIAMRDAMAEKVVPESHATAVSNAVRRGSDWLAHNSASTGGEWPDYPKNSRATPSILFGAMLLEALQGREHELERKQVGVKLWQGYRTLPDSHLYFSSDAWVLRSNGQQFVDTYRHVPYPWIALALARIYGDRSVAERVRIVRDLRQALLTSLQSPAFKRQEWLLAEHVFVLQRLLAVIKTSRGNQAMRG